MEETFFNDLPVFQNLLETKSFSELTAKEKEAVLGQMSKEEYDAFHDAIMESKMQFNREKNNLSPDPAIHQKLLEKMERRMVDRSSVLLMFQKIFTFRIPAYQPAFTFVVLVILFFIFHKRGDETIRYISKTDTVFLEQRSQADQSPKKQIVQVAVKPTNGLVKANTKKQFQDVQGKGNNNSSTHYQYVENAYQKIHLVTLLKRGHSASDDSSLLKFLVAPN